MGINIEIIGTQKTESENCLNMVTEIGKKLNIDVTVIEAKRVNREKSNTSIIIAKLVNKEMKTFLIRAAKNKNKPQI